ncbi:hypothetical protein STEG23_029423 [Scotinomys teguina]
MWIDAMNFNVILVDFFPLMSIHYVFNAQDTLFCLLYLDGESGDCVFPVRRPIKTTKSVWFYPMPLDYLVSDSWLPEQCQIGFMTQYAINFGEGSEKVLRRRMGLIWAVFMLGSEDLEYKLRSRSALGLAWMLE